MKTIKYLQELIQGAISLFRLPGDWFLAQIEKRHTPRVNRSYATGSHPNNYANMVKGQDNGLIHHLHVTHCAEKEVAINRVKKEVVIRHIYRLNTQMSIK